MTVPTLLRTENLSRSFGQLVAVDGVTVEVPAGELRAVIGPNGAGKSTFFKLISGELAPSAWRIVFDGRDMRQALAKGVKNIELFAREVMPALRSECP